MKNIFLSKRSDLDAVYPIVRSLPSSIRSMLGTGIASIMGRRQSRQLIPDRVTVLLTDQCNLKCPHCFISNEDHPAGWEMGLPEYEKLFQSTAGQIGQLVVSGGEPIIRKDFVEIIRTAEEKGKVSCVLICTNAVLPENLNTKMEELLKKTSIVFRVQTSIDGPEDIHDKHRGAKGGYQKVLESMSLMQALAQEYPGRIGGLHVNTTITNQNFDSLAHVIEDVKKYEFTQTFGFVRSPNKHIYNLDNTALISGYNPVNFDDFLTVDEMTEALKIINQNLWKKYPKNLAYGVNRVTLFSIKEMVRTGRPMTGCKSGRSELIIMPNGEVAKCEMLVGFASLKDYNWNLAKLLASQKCKDFFEATSRCFCTHECSVALSVMYDSSLMGMLFSPNGELKVSQ